MIVGAPYEDPGNSPGKKVRGKARTLTVCKKGCGYKSIQKAINAARGKDTIRVKKGQYREGVQITGKRYDGLKLLGDKPRADWRSTVQRFYAGINLGF